jgi:hypothetical protein
MRIKTPIQWYIESTIEYGHKKLNTYNLIWSWKIETSQYSDEKNETTKNKNWI